MTDAEAAAAAPLHVEEPGPNELRDPLTREELKRATVWIGAALAVVLVWFLAQPLLLIVGGLVFAAILDGGTRLLGRALPIARGWRLLIVCLAALTVLISIGLYAGSQITAQAQTMTVVVQGEVARIFGWAQTMGLMQPGSGTGAIGRQLMGSLGQLTAAVGTAFGALSCIAMNRVLGIFIAL